MRASRWSITRKPGRFSVHTLLRAYAAQQAANADEERRTATQAMLDHYLHTAMTAARVLDPVHAVVPARPSGPGDAENYAREAAWALALPRATQFLAVADGPSPLPAAD